MKVLAVIAAVLLIILLAVLPFWLLISGIMGALEDGMTSWELFKIVLGSFCLLTSAIQNGRRS